MALPAAAPYGERALQPVALLLDVGMAATITPADQRQKPLHAVTGELIGPGGRLITGGQSARFLFLPDSNIYEFSPVARSYPAPAYVGVDAPNTAFEVRFTTPPSTAPGRGHLTPSGRWPLPAGTVVSAGVIPHDNRGAVDPGLLRSIEAQLSRPGNQQNAELRLARAIALERSNQLANAMNEYKALADKEWSQAGWLKTKVVELAAAETAEKQRLALSARPPRSLAVVIGISDYQRLPRLEYAANDARLFAEYLTSSQGGGFAKGDVVVLTDRQATKAAVSSALEQDFARSGPNDTVILFFSGHGLTQMAEGVGQGFLLESDSDPQEKTATAYSLPDLVGLVRAKSSGSRLLILADWDRIPIFQDSPNKIGSMAPAQLADARIGGLLASGEGEISQSANDAEGGHGLFTYYLVQGLQANARAGNLDQVLSYVDQQVQKTTNGKQHPVRFGAMPPSQVLKTQRQVAGVGPALYRGRLQLASLGLRQGMLLVPQVAAAPGSPDIPPLGPSVTYEEQGQQILLQYLRGNDTPPKRGDFERARDLFAEAYQRDQAVSLEAKRQFFEGRALTFDDNVDPAIPLLESAIRLDPTAAYAYNGLGIAYLKKGLYPDAAWSFRDAILRASNWIYPRHNLALTYMEAGAYGPAEQVYRDAIHLEGQSASLHYGLGLLLQRTNRNREAGQQYREALRINANYAAAHTALGVVLAAG
jgi:tetratricopeptide (TPR) repeat protein